MQNQQIDNKNSIFRVDRFGLLFLLILLSIVVTAGLDNKVVSMFSIVLQIIILFLAVKASGIKLKTQRIIIYIYFLTIFLVITLLTIIFLTNPNTNSQADSLKYAQIIGILLSFTITILILYRLYRHQRINMSTVFGALCIYLQIGLLFTFIYLLISVFTDGHFFAGAMLDNRTLYPYYSFSTLTTVGFGDYTAGSNIGRMLSAFEAIVGQLYLVCGVALVVGNIGKQRKKQ